MDNVVIFLVVIGMPVLPVVLASITAYFYYRVPSFAAWHDRYLGCD